MCVISSIYISKIEPTSVQETTQKALKRTMRHAQEVRRAKKEPISSQHSLPGWCETHTRQKETLERGGKGDVHLPFSPLTSMTTHQLRIPL